MCLVKVVPVFVNCPLRQIEYCVAAKKRAPAGMAGQFCGVLHLLSLADTRVLILPISLMIITAYFYQYLEKCASVNAMHVSQWDVVRRKGEGRVG